MENVNANNATETAAEEVKTSFFGNLKSTITSPRFKRTVAAAIGTGGGLMITASSERCNKTSLAITGGLGAVGVVSIHKNNFLDQHFDDNLTTLAFIAAAKTAETALVGAVANRVIGNDPKAETDNSVPEETISNMVEQTVAESTEEVKTPSLIEKALNVFKTKPVETPAPVVAEPAVSEVKVETAEAQPVAS